MTHLTTADNEPTFPLISIVTVCLNAAAFLEVTIQSVLAQTYPHIEYIIIDGGSTDETLTMIDQYKPQLSYWVSEKDSGIYDAMNKGIKKAKGDAILMLNAGDFLTTNAIQLMVEAAQKDVKHKFICCDWVIFFNESNRQIHRKATFDFNRKNGICHQGALIGAGIYTQFGLYDTSLRLVSDYDFYVRVWKEAPDVFLNVPAYLTYFMYEGATTHQIVRSNKERWEVINRHFTWSEALPVRLVTLLAITFRSIKAFFQTKS